jgi:hypothetical protein
MPQGLAQALGGIKAAQAKKLCCSAAKSVVLSAHGELCDEFWRRDF